MHIALTGADGQLGQALVRHLAPRHELTLLTQDTGFDLGSAAAVEQVVQTRADLVIHPAAYTNVDGCARDPLLAYRINGLGTHYVALACTRLDVPLVYISTNEVFSGAGETGMPYLEYDTPAPINAYGRSKLAGEQAVRALLRRFYIVRIAWLFGGARNFVRTVLRLAQEPPAGGLRMVADEVGNPTFARDVADAIARLLPTGVYGTYHLVNQGACSRYEFAGEIVRQAGLARAVEIAPIALADYRRDSTPPPYAPLANVAAAALGIELRPWQEALADYLKELLSDGAR